MENLGRNKFSLVNIVVISLINKFRKKLNFLNLMFQKIYYQKKKIQLTVDLFVYLWFNKLLPKKKENVNI